MNESSNRVTTDESQEPQYQKNHENGPQHVESLLDYRNRRWRRNIPGINDLLRPLSLVPVSLSKGYKNRLRRVNQVKTVYLSETDCILRENYK